MKATKFHKDCKPYGQPKDWNEETQGKCHVLPVLELIHEEGDKRQLFCISGWTPNMRDKIATLQCRPTYLQIYGGQPPVSVYTTNEEGLPNDINFEGFEDAGFNKEEYQTYLELLNKEVEKISACLKMFV